MGHFAVLTRIRVQNNNTCASRGVDNKLRVSTMFAASDLHISGVGLLLCAHKIYDGTNTNQCLFLRHYDKLTISQWIPVDTYTVLDISILTNIKRYVLTIQQIEVKSIFYL